MTRPPSRAAVPALPVDRRSFLRTAGAGAAALALSNAPGLRAQEARPADRTAEALLRELYAGLRQDQKDVAVLPIGSPERMKYFDAPAGKKIGDVYTKAQQEALVRILRALSSGEEGWRRISRDGTWDESKAFENCGATLFGEPRGKFTWVFSGHHLTLRCDGGSEEGASFGGPMYYGHSPNGYSETNLFNFQTKSALAVYESMKKDERDAAVAFEDPAEGLESVKFRCTCGSAPGIAYPQVAKESQALIRKLLDGLLSPFRQEDAADVRETIRKNGGLEAMRLMFYREKDAKPSQPWNFWRLEGPGFVWHYRVLPHVHTYVNVSSKI